MEELLSKLKFLSKLRKGEKIMVKTMTFQNSDFLSSIYRSFSGETREATMDFVVELWTETAKLIVSNETDDNYRKMLASNLLESRKGIQALLGTYEADKHFCSKLESLAATIELQIKTVEPAFCIELNRKENASLARSPQAFDFLLKKE